MRKQGDFLFVLCLLPWLVTLDNSQSHYPMYQTLHRSTPSMLPCSVTLYQAEEFPQTFRITITREEVVIQCYLK